MSNQNIYRWESSRMPRNENQQPTNLARATSKMLRFHFCFQFYFHFTVFISTYQSFPFLVFPYAYKFAWNCAQCIINFRCQSITAVTVMYVREEKGNSNHHDVNSSNQNLLSHTSVCNLHEHCNLVQLTMKQE